MPPSQIGHETENIVLDPQQSGRACVSLDTALTFAITPMPADFDELGHVNNAVYLEWTQRLAIGHWHLMAGPAIQRANIFVVLRHEIDYRDPVLPGDKVVGRTWLGRAAGPRFERFVDIRKVGAPRSSASVRTDWCLIDAATRRPKRVGPDILEAFNVPG